MKKCDIEQAYVKCLKDFINSLYMEKWNSFREYETVMSYAAMDLKANLVILYIREHPELTKEPYTGDDPIKKHVILKKWTELMEEIKAAKNNA